jgi:hypothetical protein
MLTIREQSSHELRSDPPRVLWSPAWQFAGISVREAQPASDLRSFISSAFVEDFWELSLRFPLLDVWRDDLEARSIQPTFSHFRTIKPLKNLCSSHSIINESYWDCLTCFRLSFLESETKALKIPFCLESALGKSQIAPNTLKKY